MAFHDQCFASSEAKTFSGVAIAIMIVRNFYFYMKAKCSTNCRKLVYYSKYYSLTVIVYCTVQKFQ